MGETVRPEELDPRKAEAKRLFLEQRDFVNNGPWSDGAKRFFLFHNLSTKLADREAQRRRLDFLDAHVPSDVLSRAKDDVAYGSLLARVAGVRDSVLFTAHESMGQAVWEETLRDNPAEADVLSKLNFVVQVVRQSPEEYAAFAARDAVPVDVNEADPDRVRDAADLAAILRDTGVEPMVRQVAARLRVMEAEDPNDAHGVCEGGTKEIGVWSTGSKRFMLLPVLLHETGHGLDRFLGAAARGQEWYDRYAVSVVLRPESPSWYAESYRIEHGLKTADQPEYLRKTPSKLFIMESFAEDFRNYFLDQDHLPPERRKILDEVCDALFPGVDRDDVRVRISRFLREKHGVSSREAIDPTDCDRAEAAAKKRHDVRVEEARQRAEKLAMRDAKA